MRISFVAKNFTSGLHVVFDIYKKNGTKLATVMGQEWAHTGVYYIDYILLFGVFLVVAHDTAGHWKAARMIDIAI